MDSDFSLDNNGEKNPVVYKKKAFEKKKAFFFPSN